MKIVSIVNQKGGVAKTTTTANLGASLARRGFRTLVVDFDAQANLTLGLGVKREDTARGLHDVLLEPESTPLASVIRQVGDLPLYVAPGSPDMARAEAILTPLIGSAYRMKHALEALSATQRFEWVLIDCPPSLGRLTEMAIVASTHLLIPTEPKFYAFAGMDTLNKMIVGLTKDLRFEIQLLGVLLTMYEKGTRLHRMIGDEIRERFGDKVFDTVIAKNVRISESELEGQPIILFDPQARGAENYEALAQEVLQRVKAEPQSVRPALSPHLTAAISRS